jgi:hypothetical protein
VGKRPLRTALINAIKRAERYGENEINPLDNVWFSKQQLRDMAKAYSTGREFKYLDEILSQNKMSDENYSRILDYFGIDPSTVSLPSEHIVFFVNLPFLKEIIEKNTEELGEEGAIELAIGEYQVRLAEYQEKRKRMFDEVEKAKGAEEKKKEAQKKIESKYAVAVPLEVPQTPLVEVVEELNQQLLREREDVMEAKRLVEEHNQAYIAQGKKFLVDQGNLAVLEMIEKIGKVPLHVRQDLEAEKRNLRKAIKKYKKELAQELPFLSPEQLQLSAEELAEHEAKIAKELESPTGSQGPVEVEEYEPIIGPKGEVIPEIGVGDGFRRRRTYTGRYHRGAGIGDFFKEAYSRVTGFFEGPRSGAPPFVRQFMKEHGNLQILDMTVCRKPVAKPITEFLNIATLGGFKQAMKQEHYDDMFHLYLYAHVEMPDRKIRTILMEKNEIVIVEFKNIEDRGDCMAVPLSGKTTVAEFVERGEKYQGSGFWNYDPVNNNCQVFVINCLRGNQASSPSLEKFVVQNAENILTGFARKIGVAVTDLAGRIDILLHGRSLIAPSPPKRTLGRIRY